MHKLVNVVKWDKSIGIHSYHEDEVQAAVIKIMGANISIWLPYMSLVLTEGREEKIICHLHPLSMDVHFTIKSLFLKYGLSNVEDSC